MPSGPAPRAPLQHPCCHRWRVGGTEQTLAFESGASGPAPASALSSTTHARHPWQRGCRARHRRADSGAAVRPRSQLLMYGPKTLYKWSARRRRPWSLAIDAPTPSTRRRHRRADAMDAPTPWIRRRHGRADAMDARALGRGSGPEDGLRAGQARTGQGAAGRGAAGLRNKQAN